MAYSAINEISGLAQYSRSCDLSYWSSHSNKVELVSFTSLYSCNRLESVFVHFHIARDADMVL